MSSTTSAAPVREEPWPSTSALLDELVIRHEPTVFRGLAANWVPCAPSTDGMLDWLIAQLGDRPVPVSIGLPGDEGLVGPAGIAQGRSLRTTLSGFRRFSDVANNLREEQQRPTGHAIYMLSVDVDKVVPELKPHLRLPLHSGTVLDGSWRAWIGSGAHRVSLHYDDDENFYCVLAGRKRFVIAPFDVLEDVYVGPLDGPFGAPSSLVDPAHPDPITYPRFIQAQQRFQIVDLNPGDVLYLPSHWWHYVESEGLNVAANYWCSDVTVNTKVNARAAFMNSLIGVRALPRHWREFWQEMFRYHVFALAGDPYEHIPAEKQGWAGMPTPARIASIRGMVRDLEQQAAGDRAVEDLPTSRYQTASNLTIRLRGHQAVGLADGDGGAETVAEVGAIDVLAQFAEPVTVREVLAKARSARPEREVAAMIDTIRKLIKSRALVPCE